MSSSGALLATTKLSDRASFHGWFAQLKYHAQAQQVWDLINPDLERGASAAPPTQPDLDTADIDELRRYQIKLAIHGTQTAKLQGIWTWVYATVEAHLLELAILQADDQSLHALVKTLKNTLCPSDEDWKEQVSLEYREVIQRPTSGRSIEPLAWLLDWNKAYAAAKSVGLNEIKGTLPIKDFLRATKKFQENWAERELEVLMRPDLIGHPDGGGAALTIEQYAEWFSRLCHNGEITHRHGLYATLAGRSDRKLHPCPCQEDGKHTWRPVDCSRLERAVTGSTSRALRSVPTADEISAIKKRLDNEQWKSVREALQKKGWDIGPGFPGSIQA